MGSNSLKILRVSRAISVEIPPMRRLLTGRGAQLQGDERCLLQKIVTLERNDAFQHQRPLRFSIRYERTGSDHDSLCSASLWPLEAQ